MIFDGDGIVQMFDAVIVINCILVECLVAKKP